MAEEKKHKKIVKVVDIVRIDGPRKEHKIRQEQEQEHESNSMRELEELISSKNKGGRVDEEENKEKESPRRNRRQGKKALYTAIGIVALIILGYVAMTILPKAEIHIVTKKINWSNQGTVTVNKNINLIDSDSVQIPGEIVTQQKNTVMQFTPTGQKYLENKAFGVATIYNAYSSAPQTLVATTRLQTSDGKIYRLVNKVTVPGAKIVDGKITASSLPNVQIVADKAGPDYNTGPVDKLTIPGFSGTPRFEGFYASIPTGMTGGFIGNGLYPTASDISKAKDQIQQQINDALNTSLISNIPDGFTYRTDSVNSTTTKITINPVVNNQFSVVAEGTISAMIYKESDILQLMLQLAQKSNSIPQDYTELSHTLTYDKSTTDWKLGKMSLPIKYDAVFSHPFDSSQVAQSVAGKSEIDLKAYILSLPGVDKLSVAFWPFWVSSVPSKVSKIFVTIE
jgi:hypothetical protein